MVAGRHARSCFRLLPGDGVARRGGGSGNALTFRGQRHDLPGRLYRWPPDPRARSGVVREGLSACQVYGPGLRVHLSWIGVL